MLVKVIWTAQFHFFSKASWCSNYTAVNRVVRLSQYTWSSVWPSNTCAVCAGCGATSYRLNPWCVAMRLSQTRAYTSLYFTLLYSRFTDTLFHRQPVPVIRIWIPWVLQQSRKFLAVNCQLLAVLKLSECYIASSVDAPDVEDWYLVRGTLRRWPCGASRCEPTYARSCGLLSATCHVALGFRKTERPDAVHRSGASASDR